MNTVHTDAEAIKQHHAQLVAMLASELRSSARMLTQGKAVVFATQEVLVTEALRIMEKLGITGLMHENLALAEFAAQSTVPQVLTACPECPHKARLVKEFAHGGH